MRLLQLYLGGTLLGNTLQLPRASPFTQIMGASSGIASILTFWVIRNPYQTIYVYFFPVPAWAFGILFMGYSWYSMDSGGSVGHAAHFGGGLFGLALHFALKKRLFKR